jgi:hypothetical protein
MKSAAGFISPPEIPLLVLIWAYNAVEEKSAVENQQAST